MLLPHMLVRHSSKLVQDTYSGYGSAKTLQYAFEPVGFVYK
jgi:hypothetical protein